MNRIFFTLIFLCLALCSVASRAATINGQDYVSLLEWGRANGLHSERVKNGEEIVLSDKASRLVFNTDSAESEINGVAVRLSYPVAKGALISQLDLDTAVRPLVFPQKLSAKKIATICLDPGHGGKDTGNRVGWHYEKNYTLPLAFELRDQLKKLGFNVILTRSTDTFVDLPARPAIANRAGADVFISLHFNATTNDPVAVAGPETYCITPVGAASSNSQGEGADYAATVANRLEDKSLLFAYQIEKSLVQNLGADDRGVRRARFAVLRDAKMPAILIEGGYMTNPTEGGEIYDAAYRKQIAAAIVKGILNYQKLTAPPAPVVQPAAKINPPSVMATNKVASVKRT